MRWWTFFAAVGGFIAVAMGAFAAHGIADPQAKEWLRTGGQYGLAHSLAALIAASAYRGRIAPALFLAGQVFFCGSLYAMALGAPRWFGAITPIGGVLFLAGWAVLAWAALTTDRARSS